MSTLASGMTSNGPDLVNLPPASAGIGNGNVAPPVAQHATAMQPATEPQKAKHACQSSDTASSLHAAQAQADNLADARAPAQHTAVHLEAAIQTALQRRRTVYESEHALLEKTFARTSAGNDELDCDRVAKVCFPC